jgi:hypothetical protein
MRSRRLSLTALVALALAQPALAGVMYAPAANITADGILRKSTIVASNQDPVNIQLIQARFILQGTPGAPLPDPVVYENLYVGPLVNGIKTFSSSFLPTDSIGMIELVPGADNMVLASRLVYQKPGVFTSTVEMPAVGSSMVRPAGTPSFLQGLEHSSTTGVLTDLGIFNLGLSQTTCTYDVYSQDGQVLAAGVSFQVPALSSLFYVDLFGATPGTPEITVPFNSWLRVSCDQPYWAYGVRLDTTTGDARSLDVLTTPAQSTLVQPVNTPPPPPPPPPPSGGTVLLSRPGTFLIFSNNPGSNQHNVRYNFTGGGLNYDRLTLEFDVYVNRWDPSPQKAHCLFWLSKSGGWSQTLGYLNAIEGQGKMRFLVNYAVGRSQDKSPITGAGNWYRVVYEFDTRSGSRRAFYKIWRSTENGNVGALHNSGVSFGHSRNSINVGSSFVELGTQKSEEGPEAKTLGWKFANMRIVGYR